MEPAVILPLLLVGALLLAGVFTTKLASRIGVPALVLFIAVGMVLGSDISGLIYFDDARLAQLVGTTALVLILFEGGLQTRWKQVRAVLVPALFLSTAGVLITVALTGFLAQWVLGLDPPMALLVAATVGSTDAAAVFAVLRDQAIRQRLKATIELESGLNDPMAVFLTVLMLNWVQHGSLDLGKSIGFLIWQLGLGLAAGLAAGRAAVWFLYRVRFDSSALYPILLASAAIFVFAVTTLSGGSGFVAVYTLGILLGSMELPYRQSIIRFHEGIASLAQMVMFILLGLLVFPRQMLKVALPGLLIAGGLMFVARPVAIWLSTLRMGYTTAERLLLAWAGLRGAVPIILATFPLVAGVPRSDVIFHVVFFVVLTSALIQGATIFPLAKRLRLVEASVRPKAVSLELVAVEKCNADVIEVEVPKGAEVEGKRLSELNLPEQVSVSAIVRNNQIVAPRGVTRLEAGDVLFILTSKEQRHQVLELFAAGDA